MTTRIVPVIVLTLLGGTLAVAQEPMPSMDEIRNTPASGIDSGRSAGVQTRGMTRGGDLLQRMTTELALSDQQVTQIKQILDTNRQLFSATLMLIRELESKQDSQLTKYLTAEQQEKFKTMKSQSGFGQRPVLGQGQSGPGMGMGQEQGTGQSQRQGPGRMGQGGGMGPLGMQSGERLKLTPDQQEKILQALLTAVDNVKSNILTEEQRGRLQQKPPSPGGPGAGGGPELGLNSGTMPIQ